MELNNENNLIKYEGKTDFTEIAQEAYHDGGKAIVKELGKVGATIIGLINNTIGVPFELYNTLARTKVEQIKENIELKMKQIPPNRLTSPQINIIGPAIEGLKYNLDENDLKEMFTNLISNSCNKDYQNIVHPRFVEIIKQLSSNDALLLRELSKDPTSAYPVANIQKSSTNGHMTLFPNCYCSQVVNIYEVPAILNNLETLGIIKVDFENYLTDDNLYKPILNSAIYQSYSKDTPQLLLQKGVISLTILGRNFIKVCIN